MKRRRSRHYSVEHEPHLREGPFENDPTEDSAARNVERDARNQSDDDRVQQSVWDEPALSRELAGEPPPEALTWAGWLEARLADSSPGRCWLVTFGAAAAAGPLAIAGTFCGVASGGVSTWVGILAMIVFAPILEEMMKVALPLWIVEKRPFLFRSRVQIALCTLAAGFVFAAVENLLYLNVYVPEPTAGLVAWRWTVCVALHMGCSLVAGLGLMRIWSHAMTQRVQPQLGRGAPLIITAAVIHGSYNAVVVVLDALDFQF